MDDARVMRHFLGRLLIAAVALAAAACSAAAPGASLPIVPSGLATASPSALPPTASTPTTLATPTPSPSSFAGATQASQCAQTDPIRAMAIGPFDVVAEFQLTPAEFLAWHDQFIRATGVDPGHPGAGVSPWPFANGGDRPVTVCYLSGDFGSPRGNPPSGTPDYDEAVVVLNGSSVEVIALGSRDGLPLVTPTPD
jgi:hypothetical protein